MWVNVVCRCDKVSVEGVGGSNVINKEYNSGTFIEQSRKGNGRKKKTISLKVFSQLHCPLRPVSYTHLTLPTKA